MVWVWVFNFDFDFCCNGYLIFYFGFFNCYAVSDINNMLKPGFEPETFGS